MSQVELPQELLGRVLQNSNAFLSLVAREAVCYWAEPRQVNNCQQQPNMKTGLQRIEATLHQLPRVSPTSYSKPDATHEVPAPQPKSRTYSFEISDAVQKRNPLRQQREQAQLPQTSEQQSPLQKSVYADLSGGNLRSELSKRKEPKLPKLNSSLSNHHNVSISQPVLKVNELKPPCKEGVDLLKQPDIATYKAQLQEIVHQIQNLYLEGPMVDGWLESYPSTAERGTVTVSHESYVEEVHRFEQGKVICESPRPGYRLCGVDAAGQKWSRPCPLEQLASVSIAIGRYQRLLQFLEHKKYLELLIANGFSEAPE